MDEFSRMVSGELYNPGDPALWELRLRAADLCEELNRLSFRQEAERREVLRRLLGGVGENVFICRNFYCDYGVNIYCGSDIYINYNCVMLDCAGITLGNNVLIGPNCGLYTAIHPIEPELRRQGTETAKPIRIGDNVWLGGNVTVLPGVSIGCGSVIGAGSVVTKDIPENAVAFGNPCQVIRRINSEI